MSYFNALQNWSPDQVAEHLKIVHDDPMLKRYFEGHHFGGAVMSDIRRLDSVLNENEPNDAQWFVLHPERRYRLRPPDPGEPVFVDAGFVAPPGWRVWVIAKQLAPGLRAKHSVCVEPEIAADAAEWAATRLDSVTAHGSSITSTSISIDLSETDKSKKRWVALACSDEIHGAEINAEKEKPTMTGRYPFNELIAKMTPEARARAEAKAAELRAEHPHSPDEMEAAFLNFLDRDSRPIVSSRFHRSVSPKYVSW